MRAFLRLALCLVIPATLLAVGIKKTDKPAQLLAINQLAWLAGNWRLEQAGRVIEEQWMAPAGGVMLGVGRTIAKGRVVEYSFTQIREGPGGELFYIAMQSGQKEATLRTLSLGVAAVIFENKENDFPQTVAYALQADGSILAYIEGPAPDGTTKRIEFHYQRIQP